MAPRTRQAGRKRAKKPVASVIVPTRDRVEYLRVTLESLGRQRLDGDGYEIVVVDDDSRDATARFVNEFTPGSGASLKLVRLPAHEGLNAARNHGVEAAASDLLVLVDDDIEAPAYWLARLVEAAKQHSEYDVFAGRIRASLEGFRWPTCDGEEAPITTLDHGEADREVERAWGANMALRRSAYDRIGPFRTDIAGGGDEEEWEIRLLEAGGKILYVSEASVFHRRNVRDSRLSALCRASYRRGRNVRRFDERLGKAPPLRQELRVVGGCLYHAVGRRCAFGLVMAAHSAGRLREAFAR